jgi:methanogenic corrinoid protein MtbC1
LGAAVVTADSMLDANECDEAQEHLLFYITERMAARVAMVRQSFVRLDRTALLASAPGNDLSLGLRMVADYLKSAGWRTFYLGSAVDTRAMMKQIEEQAPDLIVIDLKSHSQESAALEILKDVISYRRKGKSCAIGLGGRGAVESSRALLGAGADFVAHSLREFAYEILPNLELPIRPAVTAPYLR